MKWSGKLNLAPATLATPFGMVEAPAAKAQGKRPNILVIWDDDIGGENVSAYGLGIMG